MHLYEAHLPVSDIQKACRFYVAIVVEVVRRNQKLTFYRSHCNFFGVWCLGIGLR